MRRSGRQLDALPPIRPLRRPLSLSTPLPSSTTHLGCRAVPARSATGRRRLTGRRCGAKRRTRPPQTCARSGCGAWSGRGGLSRRRDGWGGGRTALRRRAALRRAAWRETRKRALPHGQRFAASAGKSEKRAHGAAPRPPLSLAHLFLLSERARRYTPSLFTIMTTPTRSSRASSTSPPDPARSRRGGQGGAGQNPGRRRDRTRRHAAPDCCAGRARRSRPLPWRRAYAGRGGIGQ